MALFALTACGGNKTPHLMNLKAGSDGPDEFALLPPKALQMPTDLKDLPDPTPGSANLTDEHPADDAIVALGGKVPTSKGVPAADQGLVSFASRHGGDPNIRATLAAEDLAWRKDHPGKLLEHAVGLTTYFQAYREMWLDVYAELARWRAAGVLTPSAPPAPPPPPPSRPPVTFHD